MKSLCGGCNTAVNFQRGSPQLPGTQPVAGIFTFVNWVAPCPARPCAARRVHLAGLRWCLSLVAPRPAPPEAVAPLRPVSLSVRGPALARPSRPLPPILLRLAPPSRARRPPARFVGAVRLRAFGRFAVSRSRGPCGRFQPPQGRGGRYSIAPDCCGRCRPLAALLDGSLSLVFALASLRPRQAAPTPLFPRASPLSVKKA